MCGFILLGQSNAAGHGVPMKEEDKVHLPMKNVFGLPRTGEMLRRMHYINRVFEALAERYGASIFDASKAPQFIKDVRGNGIFIGDCVHYKPEVNDWVAKEILAGYVAKKGIF